MTKSQLICFTGIDGSGKTTLAKKLTIFLQEKNLPAIYKWGRTRLLFTKPLVYIGNKIFLKKYCITKNYDEYTQKKKFLFSNNNFLSKIYLHALLFDYLLQLLIKIKIPLMRRKIVVCDRYIYDTIIAGIGIDMNFSKKQFTSILDKCFLFLPKPNITFLVDIDENDAFLRKDDIPCKKYLQDRRFFYKQFAEQYNMNILDGSKIPEKVFIDCLKGLKNEFNI